MSGPTRAFLVGSGGYWTVGVEDAHRAITAPPDPKPSRVKVFSRAQIKQLERELRAKGKKK